MNNPEEIIVHHTGGTEADPLADTSSHTFEMVNAWHRQDPNVWLGHYSSLGFAIGYHYFIDKQGIVTQGRADTDEGAHCKGRNRKSLGVALAGNFDLTLPTQKQVDSLTKLLQLKSTQYVISATRVGPHRSWANKTCYGSHLSDTWASDLIKPSTLPTACKAEKDEIVELKKQISWYDSLLNLFWPRK